MHGRPPPQLERRWWRSWLSSLALWHTGIFYQETRELLKGSVLVEAFVSRLPTTRVGLKVNTGAEEECVALVFEYHTQLKMITSPSATAHLVLHARARARARTHTHSERPVFTVLPNLFGSHTKPYRDFLSFSYFEIEKSTTQFASKS